MVSFGPSLRVALRKTKTKTFLQYTHDEQKKTQIDYLQTPFPGAVAALLALVQLLHPQGALIDTSVDRRSDGQGATDHSTHTGQESGEALGTGFAVDDFHWGDVLLCR